MTEERTGNMIDDEAADWAARLDLGAVSPAEMAAFNDWAAANVRHRGAYARAAAMLEYAKRAGLPEQKEGWAFGAVDASGTVGVASPSPHAPTFRRRAFLIGGTAIAASVALGIGLSRYTGGDRYRTRTGEMQRIFLADGSVMTLNTESEAHVAFAADARSITLVKGEALFDVAHDPTRPFVVQAESTSVRAIGTSFTVRHLVGAPVNVLVREGTVEIAGQEGAGQSIRATANMLVTAPVNAVPQFKRLDEAQVIRQLAWESGMLSFEALPLDAAVAEFHRYSATRIVIADPALARTPVTGRFAANDPEGFAGAVATSLGVHVEKTGNQVTIRR